jgi:hypothetical protein
MKLFTVCTFPSPLTLEVWIRRKKSEMGHKLSVNWKAPARTGINAGEGAWEGPSQNRYVLRGPVQVRFDQKPHRRSEGEQNRVRFFEEPLELKKFNEVNRKKSLTSQTKLYLSAQ